MTTISISELKINPSRAIHAAEEYPITVENRGKTEAYLIGKDLYEKLIAYVEDYIDKKAISETDYKKGKDFEKIAKSLGI